MHLVTVVCVAVSGVYGCEGWGNRVVADGRAGGASLSGPGCPGERCVRVLAVILRVGRTSPTAWSVGIQVLELVPGGSGLQSDLGEPINDAALEPARRRRRHARRR